MRIRDMNWQQVEAQLRRDDRAIVPLGSTEQHAYLSLLVDTILPEMVAAEAAEPLGIPVFPALPFGITPYFLGYPGTISLQVETYRQIIMDVLDSVAGAGFRRIVFVNGHGGNAPGRGFAAEWMPDHQGVRVKWHDWWNAPETWAKVQQIDPVASHASWMENFPWTRLAGVAVPGVSKKPIDRDRMTGMSPTEVRAYASDGNFAGVYQKPDEDMRALWDVAVAETRRVLEGPWS
jgi:creatinine amidohydrolase